MAFAGMGVVCLYTWEATRDVRRAIHSQQLWRETWHPSSMAHCPSKRVKSRRTLAQRAGKDGGRCAPMLSPICQCVSTRTAPMDMTNLPRRHPRPPFRAHGVRARRSVEGDVFPKLCLACLSGVSSTTVGVASHLMPSARPSSLSSACAERAFVCGAIGCTWRRRYLFRRGLRGAVANADVVWMGEQSALLMRGGTVAPWWVSDALIDKA